MRKKIIMTFLVTVFVLSTSSFGVKAQASSTYSGKIVRMNGLSSLYYVASDNKRYVFPNENIFNSWFSDFDDVVTLTETELTSLPLGGNVLYRPGVLLVKITTDPKVYAVSKNGTLRWVTSEAIAKALYGNSWNKLVDDVSDAFFTNYQVGDDISNASGFNPKNEADEVDNIDANHNLSSTNALRAHTRKCQIIDNSRYCRAGNTVENTYSDDNNTPYITSINISNSSGAGYININDKITLTFSEAIDPESINSGLAADNYFSSLDKSITGAVEVSAEGVVTIKKIATFDLGAVDNTGEFAVRMDLSSNARALSITLISGNSVKIEDEDFEDAKQLAGTVKDTAGNSMEADSDIGTPSGTFGGENINDGIEPFISSIKVYNFGDDDYIDISDEIRITFSEEIDPKSINTDLEEDSIVNGVAYGKTGGVTIDDDGFLTIKNIAAFSVGKVDNDGKFDVSLALNSEGKILTIKLTSGADIGLDDEDLDDAKQIGGTVADKDGNELEDDPNIADPSGTFIGDSAGSDLYIDYIKAYDYGYTGYIDIKDAIVITFSQAISSDSIGSASGVEFDETGGVSISADGILTITDILSFDIGEVVSSGKFEVKTALSTNKKVLTITLTDGDAIKIKKEDFDNTTQFGGYVEDEDNLVVMDTRYNIDNPSGTFGGDSIDGAPYITGIEITNGDNSGYIDVKDKIIITFNEAINPNSVDSHLELDDYIGGVDDNDTGGVVIDDDGILTIADIAEFYVGNVEDDSKFEVKLALNEIGNVLTVTLESGDAVEITYEDLDDAEQIGGTIEDEDGSKMEDDPRIDDPSGSF